MNKILVTFGTRPEAVKMAPVVRALRNFDGVEPIVCLTGQHREMVEQILPIFDIAPDVDLDIMRPDQTPSDVAGEIFRSLPPVLSRLNPAMLLVQGDTTTAMASAVAAHYAGIPVGHVEAGLRTGHLDQPFPEEANRRVISAVAQIHFAPTEIARRNLLNENIPRGSVHVTGNTVVDALHHLLPYVTPAVHNSGFRRILVTAHRRESFGAPLEGICRAILEIVRRFPDVEVVFPVHPNPSVRVPVNHILRGQPRVNLIDPLNYLDFMRTLAGSYLALTDSGGVQEEAPVLGVPVLIMREHTERPEAVDAGCAALVGTTQEAIITHTALLLDNPAEHDRMSRPASPFGDGHAAPRIARHIGAFLPRATGEPLAQTAG